MSLTRGINKLRLDALSAYSCSWAAVPQIVSTCNWPNIHCFATLLMFCP